MSLTNALGNAVGAIGKMNGSMLKMHPALMGLSLATKALTAAYNRADKYAQDNIKVNERLLLLGTDRLQFSRENLAAIIDNTGSINDNMAVAAEMRALGIEQYRDQATSLAASMKMTGQNTQAALKLFGAMEFNTLMTVDQQERMSASIEKTAESFGRTAESIVKALSDINISYLTRTGQSVEGVMKTVENITGRFGGMAGEQTAALINAFQVTSAGDLGKLAMLGISEQVMAAQSGQFTPEQLEEIVFTAGSRLDQLSAGQSATTAGILFNKMNLGDIPEQILNLRQTMLGPEREAKDRPSIQDTLAAEKARANKQSEVNMATVTGFRRLTEIGIEANAILDKMSTYLTLGIADLFGATDDNLKASLAIQQEMEEAADRAKEEADIAKQARMREVAEKASARQADAAALARLTGFEFSTVMTEVVESLHRDNVMLKEGIERLVTISNNQYQDSVLNR